MFVYVCSHEVVCLYVHNYVCIVHTYSCSRLPSCFSAVRSVGQAAGQRNPRRQGTGLGQT